MHHDEAFLRRAAEAKARVSGLVPEDLEQQLERGAILIDVREPAEIKSGTIRDAHNIPLDGLLQEIEATVPDRSAPIVCFCRGGNRGALAAAALLDHGYSNVKTLVRGLEGSRIAFSSSRMSMSVQALSTGERSGVGLTKGL